MQEDKDPSKGKGDDKGNDERKLKAPSSPKSRSPSPKPRSPKMAQLAVPDEQEVFLKVSKKSDSGVPEFQLPALLEKEISEDEKSEAASAEAENPKNPRPLSDLAVHGSLNFRPPSPQPVHLDCSRGYRESNPSPIEIEENPLFPKCSPRKKNTELPKTRDSPELSPTDFSSLPDVNQGGTWTVPQLPLELSSDTEQFTDSADATVTSSDIITQSSCQQSLSPDSEQAVGCFPSFNLKHSRKGFPDKDQLSDGTESALSLDIPQTQQLRSQSPKKETSPCKSTTLKPYDSGAEEASDAANTSLDIPQRSPQRSPSPMKEFFSALSLKSCMSRQDSLSGIEGVSDSANATSLDISQRSPQKSPSSAKKQVSKLFGRKHRLTGAEEEPHSADTLIPKELVQSSPTKKGVSKYKASGAKQESPRASTFIIPKAHLRQSPNASKRGLGWNRSSSSSPSKRSQKPFYETLHLERTLRRGETFLGGYQSDNAEQLRARSPGGAYGIEHPVVRSQRSPHGSSISERPSYKSSEFDESLALSQSQQSSRSASGRERTSPNRDSEMGAFGNKAQASPVDVVPQAISERERSSNPNGSSSDDEFFSKINLERMNRMRSLMQSNRSIWGGDGSSSSNIPDSSEMGASLSTFSVDSVFESETQEPRTDIEAQVPPVDADQQARGIFERERSPNHKNSSSEDEFFNKLNFERTRKLRRQNK